MSFAVDVTSHDNTPNHNDRGSCVFPAMRGAKLVTVGSPVFFVESDKPMNIKNENRRAKVREDGTYEIVLTWKQQERLFGIVQDALYEAVSTAATAATA